MPISGVLRSGWTLTGLVAAVLTAAHLDVLRQGTGLAGPLLILDHLFTIALACGLLGLCAALGRLAIRRLRFDHDSSIETLAFSMAIGAGLLATAILLCGALGGLKPSVLGLVLVAGAVASRYEIARLPGLLRDALSELQEKAGGPALVVFCVVAAVMTVQAVAPTVDWDSLMYHLQVPALFLERGAVYSPEDNLHVAYVSLVHMLYLPLLAFGAPAACALVNTIFALALGAALLTAGVRDFSTTVGRLAIVLLWGSPIVLFIAITPRVDVTLACYLFLGHYALLCALRSTENRTGWLVLAGGLLGFAAGIKYQALAYVAALAPIVLSVAVTGALIGTQRVRPLAVFGTVFAAAVLPWLLKNWVLVGAPLYPFFTETILPPWLAALQGTPGLPSGIDPASLASLSAVREPFDLVSWLIAPERLNPEGEAVWYRANAIFLFLPLAVPLLRNRTFAAWALPGLFYIVVTLSMGARTNLRYLLPAIPALTLAASVVLASRVARLRRRSGRVLVIGLATALSLSASAMGLAHRLERTGAVALAAGLVSRDGYWRDSGDPEIAAYAQTTAYVNGRLPRDARVLLLFDARGYGYAPHVLQDNVLTNWPLLASIVTPPRCLESSGITHVLVNTEVLTYYVNRGLDPNVMLWDRFDDFASRCLVLLDRRPGLDLYAVEPR